MKAYFHRCVERQVSQEHTLESLITSQAVVDQHLVMQTLQGIKSIEVEVVREEEER